MAAGPPVLPTNLAQDNQRVIQLNQQALAGELDQRWHDALNLYNEIVPLLTNIIAASQKKTEERRRSKLQLKQARERIQLLRYVINPKPGTGQKTPTPPPLPSLMLVEREWRNPEKTVLLSLVENGTYQTLFPPPGSIGATPSPSPFLTPLLSQELPDYTYHLYFEVYNRFPSVKWINIHIKDHTKQTVYTISARKHRRYQIPALTMLRAAAYNSACAQISVSPVRPVPNSDAASRLLGRPLTIVTGVGTTVVDAPDRLERQWTPSRFNYGGRRFVWKDSKSHFNLTEDLYEVKREWDKPGSKTGKKEEETFERRIMWGGTKFAMKKAGVLHMVGGLDQIFREFLLASAVSKMVIRAYGHD